MRFNNNTPYHGKIEEFCWYDSALEVAPRQGEHVFNTVNTLDITGSNNTLTAMQIGMSPMYNTNSGSLVSSLGVGMNYIPSFLDKTRIAGEISTPVSKDTNTLALIADTSFTFGIQQSL